jgi:glutamate carboxypeptidase
VLLLAHLDTVWPLGTLGRWPVERDGDRLTGPGAFDTKAGIVQALHALQALQEQGSVGVELLVNSDEEVGSPTSSELIEAASRQARAVLVLEPSQGGTGALKTARKGFAVFRLRVQGRAAHAGNQPELGVNALVELARQVTAVERLGRPGQGTTVTPTLASAGTTSNTVPAQAELHLDVRFLDPGEHERVARDLRALTPELPGARLELLQGPSSPPLPPAASRRLYPVARRLGEALGLGLIDGVAVGGGSDGNRAAAAGAAHANGRAGLLAPVTGGRGPGGGGTGGRRRHLRGGDRRAARPGQGDRGGHPGDGGPGTAGRALRQAGVDVRPVLARPGHGAAGRRRRAS